MLQYRLSPGAAPPPGGGGRPPPPRDWGSEAPQGSRDEITVGPLSISEMRHEAFCGGEPLSLTSREFDLLLHFMENPGVALSRDALLQHVWGWDFAGGSRTVDMHVLTLRQKLGEHASLIETVRGVGYRLVSQ